MRLLLDTHTLLWLMLDSPRLSQSANAALDDPDAELLVSAVSAYEISLKHQRGRLPEAGGIADNLTEVIETLDAAALPITVEHAQRAGALGLVHKDPFDRLLAAQAIVENIPIVSADPAFDTLGARRIW